MKRIMTIICALALIAVTLLAVTLNTWLNAKSGQLVSAEREIDELTSLVSRLNEDAELSETANARLRGDLEESRSILAAKDQEISGLTEELKATRTALSAARRAPAETQSELSSGENAEARGGSLEKTYTEAEVKAAIASATAPLQAIIDELKAQLEDSGGDDDNSSPNIPSSPSSPPPDKQAINTAIETTRADINKLSARMDSEITVKGMQAAVGEAITATQATLDELAAQYENAPMGDDRQTAIADAISSTQASIDNLAVRIDNASTASSVQAAVAETIASTQAVLDELTSHLEH